MADLFRYSDLNHLFEDFADVMAKFSRKTVLDLRKIYTFQVEFVRTKLSQTRLKISVLDSLGCGVYYRGCANWIQLTI